MGEGAHGHSPAHTSPGVPEGLVRRQVLTRARQAGGSALLTRSRQCQSCWSVDHAWSNRALRYDSGRHAGITQRGCRCHEGAGKAHKPTRQLKSPSRGREHAMRAPSSGPSHQLQLRGVRPGDSSTGLCSEKEVIPHQKIGHFANGM